MFGLNRQEGNASILVVMLGAVGLLGVLSQSQGIVSSRLKASKVKKVLLESHESGLHALSVTRQLVQSYNQNLPTLGFRNVVNPTSAQDIAFRSLEANPNPTQVALSPNGSLLLSVPDVMNFSSREMDQIFQTKNFQINSKRHNLVVRPIGWESFATGYGIQTLYVEAETDLKQAGVNRPVKVRAKMPVSVPQGRCTATANSSGAAVANGASLPNGSTINVNLQCTGVVLFAQLFNNGAEISRAGPVTAANDYQSNVPALLPATQITTSGNHLLQARWRLVDGTILTSTIDLTFSIESRADPLICRRHCTCEITYSGQICPVNARYVDPYSPLPPNAPLPMPMPRISGNPMFSPADRSILINYAAATGFNQARMNWQGTAFPNYPNVLVCADGRNGFNLIGFDPANNCAPSFVSARSIIGCVREGSRITVRPGVQVPIESLRPGDHVWNPLQSRPVLVTKVTAGAEQKPLRMLSFAGRTLAVTETHPMLTPAGFLRAEKLQAGDLLRIEGVWQRLESIRADASHPGEIVWNLEIAAQDGEDSGLFEAEGVAVGDLNWQKKMESVEHEQ